MSKNESSQSNNSERLILVVDNENKQSCSLIASPLRQANYQVTEVSIDSENLKLRVEQADMIILDLTLSKNSQSIEICQLFKADISTQSIPILCILAAELVTTQEQIDKLDNQADSYLVQPINTLELLSSVKTLLRIRQSEQTITESEGSFRFMADTSQVMFWMSGVDNLCYFFNQTWLDFTGRTLEQELGNGWAEGVHSEDLQHCLDTYRTAFESQKVFEIDYRLRRADGKYRWVLDRGVPRFTEKGIFLGYVGSCIDITERKDIEQALHKSQVVLDAINDNTPTFLFIKDREGKMIMANPAIMRALRKAEHDIVGWTDAEFLSSQAEAEKIIEHDRQVMNTGEALIVEETLSLAEGKRIFISTKAPYRDKDGNIIGVIGVATDITEYKETQQALNKSEESLRIALEASKLGMWHWEINTDKLTWTDRCKALFGLAPETEMSYQVFLEALHPDDRQRTQEAVASCIENGMDYDIEYRTVWPDGTVRWIAAKGNCKHNSDKQPTNMMGVALNITERKETELALSRSEELFRTTFEKAAVGVTNMDLQGHWLQVNEKFCHIVNYSRSELLSMTFQQITHPDDLEKELNYIRELLAGEIYNYSLEKRYICKGGFPVWVSVSVSLLREQTSHLQYLDACVLSKSQYLINVVEDISERKEIEFELCIQEKQLKQMNESLRETTDLLKRRNQELDSFCYIVSHDLKAPLRGITNLSEWIEEALEDALSDESRRMMKLLRERVSRMESLINGLLEYSRAERSAKEAEMVDVGELLLDTIDSLAPPLGFVIQVEPNMPKIITKRVLLGQVFANLIGNSIKHHNAPNSGRVIISAAKEGKFYRFFVSDDGPGIDPINHEKIFGIFHTLQLKDAPKNTGIGLSIVKKIVESEGGKITLESTLGRGATFSFTWLAHSTSNQLI